MVPIDRRSSNLLRVEESSPKIELVAVICASADTPLFRDCSLQFNGVISFFRISIKGPASW